MNDWGIPVLTPSLLTFGTCGHYARENGLVELADEELRAKNRKTVGFYRLLSPVVLSVDVDLLTPIFTTHFGSFTNRQPDIGSFGMGKAGVGNLYTKPSFDKFIKINFRL